MVVGSRRGPGSDARTEYEWGVGFLEERGLVESPRVPQRRVKARALRALESPRVEVAPVGGEARFRPWQLAPGIPALARGCCASPRGRRTSPGASRVRLAVQRHLGE